MSLDSCLIFIDRGVETFFGLIEAFFGSKRFVWKTPRTIDSLESQVVRFKN